MRNKLLLSLLFLCPFLPVFSQKGQVQGLLTDTSGKKTIPYATVTVFQAADTAIVTYRLSDDYGRFKVPGLPLQQDLRVVITATGYEVFRKEFRLQADSSQLELGTIKMNHNLKELDEVLVIAERPPVMFRKDTIEFNANAFKTLPTALVEDLLRKFPGVDVDKEGNITVNGRKANRMLVDSKEFFGTDPKVASKNLPANIIDKVQISDDNEQKERNPDLAPGELGVVINLKLKKSIKKGWFGKLYAGAGTRERYETGGIVNLFRDTLQVSLLGYSNNLNRTGFGINDIMNIGGFNRTNVNSVMISSDGGFAMNGISFGGMGQGIVRSSGAGINVNTILKKNVTLGLQYFYGRNNTKLGQQKNVQQFFGDTTLYTLDQTASENIDNSHRISGSLRWKIDSLSTLTFRPSFTISDATGESNFDSRSFSNFEPELNSSINSQRSNTNGFATNQELSYSRNFKKAGRTFFASATLDLNNNDNEQYNDVQNIFYKIPATTLLNQLREQEQDNTNARLYISYAEPLTKTFQLTLWQSLELFSNKDKVQTFEYDQATRDYTLPDPDFTNGIRRSGSRSTSYAGLRIKYKKLQITPALTLKSLQIDNRFQKNPAINQRFQYLFPALSVRAGIWNFNYSVGLSEPQATELQPVANNTNPVYLMLGNPELKPTISHTINVNVYKFDVKSGLNYNLYMNTNINRNGIIRERTVDENGVQVSRPVNANGIWRSYASGRIQKQYKFSQQWKFSLALSMYGAYNRSIVLLNQNRSNTDNWSFSPGINWSINWNDKVELNQRYGPTWNKSVYESNIYPSLQVWKHTASTEVVLRMPKHWVWESSLDYNYNPQVASNIQRSILRWNAAVNFLFLKDDKGQFKLSVYDLLNQNTNVNRTVTENRITDIQTTILQRYFLLTFTYNIRNFVGKVGGRARLIMF